ncbi:hypothetical protein [Kitasatospora sp. MMS16-BH015]|uniref:hypothetical protein n=1 Tax=Kitasatospora sp. MMS16-BH015 TaxID=2018025 RepID=UPI000CF2C457|nr:hypothetical protein [Kitasatospora sp. MMS16-BH015]
MDPNDMLNGETLSDRVERAVLEPVGRFAPVLRVALEPRSNADQQRLGVALAQLAEEEASFRVHPDEETGQTLVGAMSEQQLEILVGRLEREFRVGVNVSRPQVVYRETIRRAVECVEYTHRKQTGCADQYARVRIGVEPIALGGAGYEFTSLTGGGIPVAYVPSVDAGCRSTMQSGVLAGCEVIGVRVTLLGGLVREAHSSDVAFRTAGARALTEALRQADPVLVEPVMAVEVSTPEDCVGGVIADLGSRRGEVRAWERHAGGRVVQALVPVSELLGYSDDLAGRTSGRASWTMRFDSYAEVPHGVAEQLIANAEER